MCNMLWPSSALLTPLKFCPVGLTSVFLCVDGVGERLRRHRHANPAFRKRREAVSPLLAGWRIRCLPHIWGLSSQRYSKKPCMKPGEEAPCLSLASSALRSTWCLSTSGVRTSWCGASTWRTCRPTRRAPSHSSTSCPGWTEGSPPRPGRS